MEQIKPSTGNLTPGKSLEGNEKKEHDKDFFSLQIEFAKKLAEVSGEKFSDVLLHSTTLYRRFRLGKVLDPNNPIWLEFLSKTDGDLAQRAYEFYVQGENREDQRLKRIKFGCFQHDYNPTEKTVFIHFGNQEKTDSPFQDQEKRKQELRTMFEYIKKHYPEAEYVRGHSWLYNLEKYRSLFPKEYTDNLEVDQHPTTGLSTWGQFLDRQLKTRPDLAAVFLQKISSAKNKQEILDAFPNKVLKPKTRIEDFYRFYNIS
jgi:hypothetical protein